MFLTHLILKNQDGTESVVSTKDLTREQLAKWVNQAESFEDRQKRKEFMYGFIYGVGPKTFSSALGIKLGKTRL